MFRQANLERALLSAVTAVLLLTTGAQSLQTTQTPLTSNSTTNVTTISNTTNMTNTTNTTTNNSVMEEPIVLRSYRSCESEHQNFCQNGGECKYLQDDEHQPFCICPLSFTGARCHFIIHSSGSQPEVEKLIGIILGVVMILVILAIIIYCLIHRRCTKKASLIKSAASETSV